MNDGADAADNQRRGNKVGLNVSLLVVWRQGAYQQGGCDKTACNSSNLTEAALLTRPLQPKIGGSHHTTMTDSHQSCYN